MTRPYPAIPAASSTLTVSQWTEIMRGRTLRGARWLSTAAGLGDSEAQAVFGQWLLDGRGVQRDPAAAFNWFSKASAQGHVMATNMTGRCLEHGWGTPVDLTEAARKYAQAAKAGLDWGMYNLANLLATGRGTLADQAGALGWYRKAAGLGHASSMNMVGRYLDEGLVVARDPLQAVDWYRRSAEAGDFRGQFSYGTVLVEAGLIEEAERWLSAAIEKGSPSFLLHAAATLARSESLTIRQLGLRAEHRAPSGSLTSPST